MDRNQTELARMVDPEDALELRATLLLCLPTIEHEYHTNHDGDGELWRRVERVRAILEKTGGID